VSHDRTVLLYSPKLIGHRQLYCRVLASILVERGYRVVVAGSLTEDGQPVQSGFLEGLGPAGSVSFVDTGHCLDGSLGTVHGLASLIRDLGADTTVFTEADSEIPLLVSQIRPGTRALPGRRVGIFLRSTSYIHAEPRRSLRTRLRRARRASLWMADPRLFHRLLLPRFKLLDAACCLDEVFVAGHAASHQWLPDMYREPASPSDGLSTAARSCISGFEAFVSRNVGRPIYLYLGTPQRRRGYDVLLRVAVEEDGCFVNCGKLDVEEAYDPEAGSHRSTLAARGALFETGEVFEFAVADVFIAATRGVVLPYRNHYGSSGIMLHILSAGRPVLVPDVGLMADRTKAHGLGRTYRPDDIEDLKREFRALQASPETAYAANIRRFLQFFSEDRVRAAIVHAVTSEGAGVPWPSPVGGLERGQ